MMQLDSKILITGQKGFVGQNLVNELTKRGYKNLCFPGTGTNLREKDDVFNLFSSELPEYVFNLSAKVGGIQANIENPYKFLLCNLEIQNNLIDNAINWRVEKFLNLGSSCIYPANYKQPLKEEYLLQADLEKTNEGYALAKICGLKLCEYANKQQNVTKFISLMPCNLFGPYDHFNTDTSHVLSALIVKAYNAVKNGHDVSVWGTGKQFREFLFVEDLVDGMIWSMNNLEKTDTFLNIGTGEDVTINALAQKIIDNFRSILKIKNHTNIKNDLTKPDGMMRKCLDVSKINILGWKAKTDLDEGIKKTVKWFLKNRKDILK